LGGFSIEKLSEPLSKWKSRFMRKFRKEKYKNCKLKF
jgi:hypothetical protein